MTLRELALALGAQLQPEDAAQTPVDRVGSAGAAGGDCVVFAETERALAKAQESAAAAVLTTATLHTGANGARPVLLVPHPRWSFAQAAKLLRRSEPFRGVDPLASVHPSAAIPPEIEIGPFAVIGEGVVLGNGTRVGAGAILGAGCVLGPGCRVYPRAVLYPGVVLGARVAVHAGAVLGSDGFGYARHPGTGEYLQLPQQGQLVVEDDVEIGANTTIDRGALDETRVGRGSKLDNLVHLGHNVQVGEDVVMAAQTGVSGSSRIGAGAVIAGQVGIADHVTIGEGAILGAQCGVPSHKQIHGPGALFWGTPARPIAGYLRELATLARLTKKGRRG